MAEKVEDKDVVLDKPQVRKAVQALLAFLKTTTKTKSERTLLGDNPQISLLFTFWKVPNKDQKIRVPLPHAIRSDLDDICLFTRDEPNMSSDQTQRFYKKLLEERGVKNITEIIPYKVLKTEYKPFEAKRKLLGNFDMFLSDDRIRRLLPSHIGRHFYDRKKDPLSINLNSKNLNRDIQRLVQSSLMKVTKKGCCSMAKVGNSGMTADEIMENIVVTIEAVASKLQMTGKVIKMVHVKSETSVSLPIYTSSLENLGEIEAVLKEARKVHQNKKGGKKKRLLTENPQPDDDEEEIPDLVPIETPSKKAKTTPKKKKALEDAPQPTGGKKSPTAKGKLAKKTAKSPSQKFKRKALKS